MCKTRLGKGFSPSVVLKAETFVVGCLWQTTNLVLHEYTLNTCLMFKLHAKLLSVKHDNERIYNYSPYLYPVDWAALWEPSIACFFSLGLVTRIVGVLSKKSCLVSIQTHYNCYNRKRTGQEIERCRKRLSKHDPWEIDWSTEAYLFSLLFFGCEWFRWCVFYLCSLYNFVWVMLGAASCFQFLYPSFLLERETWLDWNIQHGNRFSAGVTKKSYLWPERPLPRLIRFGTRMNTMTMQRLK